MSKQYKSWQEMANAGKRWWNLVKVGKNKIKVGKRQ